MISRIWRPIRDGFKGFVRHGAMALSSSVAVTITLIIIGIFGVFMTNVSRFTEGLEQSVQISVKVDYDYEAASEEDRISLAIAGIPGCARSIIPARRMNSSTISTVSMMKR